MDPEAVARLAGEGVHHGSSDDPAVLDFSANCNPHVPAGVESVYADALDASRRYPDDDYPEFRAAAADHVGCDPAKVIPTPGGLAAIRLTVGALVDADDRVRVPAPSFGEYRREVELQGGDPEIVPHDAMLDRDPADVSLVVCCTPNNPTGDAYDPAALRTFARRCRDADTPLLVDEAFLGFTEIESLAGTPGVVVARSLTKLFGLPGLRAGFAVATGDLRERLVAARLTWGLGTPAARVGTHCLGQREFVARTRERVATERERLVDALSAVDGIDVVGPEGSMRACASPFVLFEAGSSERVDRLLDAAQAAGIVLRDARTFEGLNSHVRVAVRLPEENDRLLEVLTDD